MPKWLEVRMTADEVICDAKPCVGLSRVKPWPMVRMMRHPPMYVPIPMAMPQVSTTHIGVDALAPRVPLATRASVMTPIVFWASLVP
jgi:hypothetical protein